MKNDKMIALGVKKYVLRKKKEFLKSLELEKNPPLKLRHCKNRHGDSEE